MTQFLPSIAEKFHIRALNKPKGWFEHCCPSMSNTFKPRRVRIILGGDTSTRWRMRYASLDEEIYSCPWCHQALPRPEDFECNCGRDKVERDIGYRHLELLNQPFHLANNHTVYLNCAVRVTRIDHKSECPARNLPRKGSFTK